MPSRVCRSVELNDPVRVGGAAPRCSGFSSQFASPLLAATLEWMVPRILTGSPRRRFHLRLRVLGDLSLQHLHGGGDRRRRFRLGRGAALELIEVSPELLKLCARLGEFGPQSAEFRDDIGLGSRRSLGAGHARQTGNGQQRDHERGGLHPAMITAGFEATERVSSSRTVSRTSTLDELFRDIRPNFLYSNRFIVEC